MQHYCTSAYNNVAHNTTTQNNIASNKIADSIPPLYIKVVLCSVAEMYFAFKA